MKIERLRKSHKKEIIIGTVLLVVIGGALTFNTFKISSNTKYKFSN